MMELNPSKPLIAKPRDAAGHCMEQEPLWPVWLGWEGASCCHKCTRASHVHQEKLSVVLSPGKMLLVASPAGHMEGQSTH